MVIVAYDLSEHGKVKALTHLLHWLYPFQYKQDVLEEVNRNKRTLA
jgi:hypothetical protein